MWRNESFQTSGACLSALLLHREHLRGGGKGPPGSPQSAVRQQQPGEAAGRGCTTRSEEGLGEAAGSTRLSLQEETESLGALGRVTRADTLAAAP